MVGKTILHYRILEKLGAGGMGEIYKAEDTRLHRPVAIKVLSTGMASDPERRKRFFQEAQAASALNHPNIITLYDIVSEGDLQCIIMEYIAGETLREVIPAGGLPAPQALQYGVQIASALSAAHAANIIHRDLKPSNVMVAPGGLVKLLDFGLAKWMDSGVSDFAGEPGEQETVEAALTREGAILGTVSYMSPEQAEGRRVDARSDIFSFGSVLYEMVTGRRAFEGRSGISTLSAILRDDVAPIYNSAPDVPPLLEQIILRCLMKDPAARWQSMKELGAALLSLQRQLDPGGHYASPVRTSSLSTSGPPVRDMAETVVTTPPPPRAPAGSSPPSARSSPKSAPPSAPSKASRSTPAAPARPQTKPSGKPASNTMVVLVLAVIGLVVIGAAAGGGWYWWTHLRRPANQPVAAVTTPPPTPTPQSAAPPPATPTPEPPPPEPAPNPATAPPAASSSTANKTPRPVKQAAKNTNKAPEATPAPAPTPAPVNPAPAPVATPAPATPAPAAPPPVAPATTPVVAAVPVAVGDALPFVIVLSQDISSDTPEGTLLRFTATEGLRVGDKTVIGKGASVTGVIAMESGKKFLGMGGGRKLGFQLQQAEAVDGKRVRVRAMAGRAEDGAGVRSFDTGKGSKTKGLAAAQGTQYIAYIDGEQTVSVNK